MPALDLADDTFLAVPPARVAAVVADPASWRLWWPDLSVVARRDRGVEGIQWTVGGPLAGSMEIWLEQVAHGTVLHWYLRADPARGERVRRSDRRGSEGARRVARERDRRVRAWKVHAFALKDRLEWAERVM